MKMLLQPQKVHGERPVMEERRCPCRDRSKQEEGGAVRKGNAPRCFLRVPLSDARLCQCCLKNNNHDQTHSEEGETEPAASRNRGRVAAAGRGAEVPRCRCRRRPREGAAGARCSARGAGGAGPRRAGAALVRRGGGLAVGAFNSNGGR